MAQKSYVIPLFIPHSGCPFQCIFCDQKQISGVAQLPSAQSVQDTITEYLKTIPEFARTVRAAFYGGNFTGLPVPVQERYLKAVNGFVRSGRIDALRISTRPDCIDRQTLDLLRQWGVTEIELGIQSFDDTVLTASQRGYTAQQAIDASREIRRYGFLLGHQLMVGLPGDNWDALVRSALVSVRLKPDMVRIYPTLVIRNTPLAELSGYEPLSFEEAYERSGFLIDMYEKHRIRILRVGLHPPRNLSSIVSGPFHPAFRSCVYSHMWHAFFLTMLSSDQLQQVVRIMVSYRDLSHVVGYGASNRSLFAKQCVILPKDWLVPGHVIMQSDDGCVYRLNRNRWRYERCDEIISRYCSKDAVR